MKHVATAPKSDGQAVFIVWRRVRLFKVKETTGLVVFNKIAPKRSLRTYRKQAGDPQAYTFTEHLFPYYTIALLKR